MRDLYNDLDEDIEARARQVRQSVLTSEHPPRYEAVVEEVALRRNAVPADVIRDQLAHLSKVTSLPNVIIRVLPLSAKVADFYVPHSAFSLYRFHDPEDPETVVLETLASDVHLRDDEDLKLYRMVYGWLRDAALSAEESTELIATLASQA